ncbi:hypothetical protein AB0L40_21905 [Patulibacter sp. NPDC049589]|uniref:hypothetical protein n=1 Tax=Patulibacter sp. NPDC049589 TaxID=3154731 RepID=UPI00341AE2DE
MAESTPPDLPVPGLGPVSDDARLSQALHALADLRTELQDAQRTLAGTIAQLAAIGGHPDDFAPPGGA